MKRRIGLAAMLILTTCTHGGREQTEDESDTMEVSSASSQNSSEGELTPAEPGGFFTFTVHSPDPREIGRGRYPRNHMLQFKKVSPSNVPDTLAIKAMLDDPAGYIGSPLFNSFMAELTDEDVPGEKIELTDFFRRQVEAKATSGSLTLAEAAEASKELLNQSFEYIDSMGKIKERFVDAQRPSYLKDRTEVVLTNIIMALELEGAERVLLAKDNSVRALDTNYWNKIHYQKWFLDRQFLGTFVFPGYLEPIDTVGYEIRKGAADRGVLPIEIGLYEVVYNQVSYILVASGKLPNGKPSYCVQLEPSSRVFYHCQLVSRPRRPLTPLITKQKVTFHGILHVCQDEAPCEIPAAVTAGLEKAASPLSLQMIRRWEDIPLTSGQVHYQTL